MKTSGWQSLAFLMLAPLAVQAAPPEVTPEKLKAALPALDKLVEQTLQKTGVPGVAIAVVHRDQVVHLKGFGVRAAGRPELVDADTVFQIASMSKPMATTVLARLVGDKVIRWDDRVIDHLPEFRMYDPWVTRELTLRDCLCHRSGLPEQAGDWLEDIGYERDAILHRLRFLKPASSFRSRYAYTNFGFTAAAVAGAKAAGKPWEDLCAEQLYRPLGMTATSSRYADYAAAKNRVLIHVRVDGKWTAKNIRQPDAQAPAGGVSSTARDLAQWMRLQLAGGAWNGKPLVDAKALAETHQPQIVSGYHPETRQEALYALGWGISRDEQGRLYWKHSGAFFLGIRTEVALLPAEGLGIITLSNAAPTGVPEGINASFFDLVLHGKLRQDWITLWNDRFEQFVQMSLGAETNYAKPSASPSPALPAATYVGRYANDYFGAVEVVEQQGALQLRLGPKPLTFPLRHYDRDVFVYQPTGESAGGPSGVTFTVGPQRQASRVVIECLNGNGQGAFERMPLVK
ncbi:MAG: serine hydrolase [Planctomycetia bacterium]|nr:serine hydrolase [Planctomycetia bacterium]